MVINESMKNTDRMAIKLKNGSKIVITRHYLEGNEYYLVNSSSETRLNINGEYFDNTRSIISLSSLVFDENDIRLSGMIIKNMTIKTVHFATDDGFIDTFEVSEPKEPEESIITEEVYLFLEDVDKVITDPEMFLDMLKSNIIDATAEELAKYDLIPSFSVVESGKIKIKEKKNKYCKN